MPLLVRGVDERVKRYASGGSCCRPKLWGKKGLKLGFRTEKRGTKKKAKPANQEHQSRNYYARGYMRRETG